MGRLLVTFCVVLTVFVAAGSTLADGKEKVICDEKFKMMVAKGSEEVEVGRRNLKATQKDGEIEVTETMSMDHRGMKVGWKTTVKYKTKPSLTPVIAEGETYINGKVCMQGKVKFAKGKADISITGKTDKRGNPIDPPRKMERKDVPMAKKTIVFPRHLRAIGPMLIKEPGELKTILKAEFPDDLDFPEFINFKERYRLVRKKPKTDGSFVIELSWAHGDQPELTVEFDSQGKCISERVPPQYARFKEVPIEEPAHPALKELEKRLKKLFEKSCPKATLTIEKGQLVARYRTRKFMVHRAVGKVGQLSEKAYEETGPDYKGFLLRLRVRQQRTHEDIGQLQMLQTRKERYWYTYNHGYPLEGKKECIDMQLSYRNATSKRLMEKIKQAIARYAGGEK